MRVSSNYALQPLEGEDPTADYRRRLVREGVPLPAIVEGDGISLEFSIGAHALLATHYDYYDGCSHWFHLLDARGVVRDRVSPPDGFGFLEGVEILAPDRLLFRIHGSKRRWMLQVREEGFRSYAPPVVVLRPLRLALARRYLVLTQD